VTIKFTGALVVALAALVVLPLGASAADNGNAPPTLSFFSGGGGAHAGWVATDDQPAVDTDYHQAIQIHDTLASYAGVLVHHVYGMATASFPNSTFDFKSNLVGASLGYPRLVILFSDGGRAELRPLTWQQTWSKVADPNWDSNGGACGFAYETTWQTVQACHPLTFVTNEYITTDPGIDVDFLIDNLQTAGKNFSSASDNGGDGADNTTATFTPDLDALLANPISIVG
jgi:hypothetical protein